MQVRCARSGSTRRRRRGTEVRRRCGVVPARPALYDRLSGYDNLRYAAELFEVDAPIIDRRASRRRPSGSASTTRFAPQVGGYSTGMKARLRARPRGAARTRPPAARRAHRGPRSRVGHRRCSALIDEMAERRQDRRDVHAPAARGRRPRRPGRGHGPRHTLVVRLARAELTHRYWPGSAACSSTPSRPDGARPRARPSRTCSAYQRNGVAHRRPRRPATRCPSSSTTLVPPARGSHRVEPQAPTLEELYFAIRNEHARGAVVVSRTKRPPSPAWVDRAHRPAAAAPGPRLLDAACRSSRSLFFVVIPGDPAADHHARQRRRARARSSATSSAALPDRDPRHAKGERARRRRRTRSPSTCSRRSRSSCRSRCRRRSAPTRSSASASAAAASSSPTPPPPSARSTSAS